MVGGGRSIIAFSQQLFVFNGIPEAAATGGVFLPSCRHWTRGRRGGCHGLLQGVFGDTAWGSLEEVERLSGNVDLSEVSLC